MQVIEREGDLVGVHRSVLLRKLAFGRGVDQVGQVPAADKAQHEDGAKVRLKGVLQVDDEGVPVVRYHGLLELEAAFVLPVKLDQGSLALHLHSVVLPSAPLDDVHDPCEAALPEEPYVQKVVHEDPALAPPYIHAESHGILLLKLLLELGVLRAHLKGAQDCVHEEPKAGVGEGVEVVLLNRPEVERVHLGPGHLSLRKQLGYRQGLLLALQVAQPRGSLLVLVCPRGTFPVA
mmetsp:Transcript_6682/g.12931  ORF Transcript_6682/g.12931 Transcript_6682/m.12931 type:complete len:234 (-) Transcript_6682:1035-1736(-)